MQFEVKNKKIIEILQNLSLKSVAVSIVSSFLIASAASMGIAYFIVPTNSKGSNIYRGRAKIDLPEKGLSKEDSRVILQRNIFNSEGALGLEEPEISKNDMVSTGQLVKSNLPLKVRGIIFGGDPKLGLATLENTQKRKTDYFVVEDMVTKEAKLVEVYEDRVILEVDGRREYIEVEPFELVRTRRKKGSSSRGPRLSRLATKPPPDSYQEDGFQRKSNEIVITEEFKRNILNSENMAKILQDAKAEPNMVNGELRGFRLTRIREASIYEKAGFQNQDVIEEINGIPLRDAAGAIRLLQQLKSAKDIEVRITRGGSTFDMSIEIQ